VSAKERIVCGLDVGSAKICAVVARMHADGKLEVIGSGYSGSRGLTKGVIVDLEQTVASIRRAAEELESESGFALDWAVTGISGGHVQSEYVRGAIPVEGKRYEVTAKDMRQVIQAARCSLSHPDREVLHVFPQEFWLDGHKGVQNPVGLIGTKLFANVHVVTADGVLIQDLINAVNKARVSVRTVVCQPIASGEAVLTLDEKELGTVVIDIGAGTTGIALFLRNSIAFTSVIPVGGAHFTRDLVEGISAPADEAERVKIELGSVLLDQFDDQESITVRQFGTRGPRGFELKEIRRILHARAEELLQLVKREIVRSGLQDQLVAGVVLTGGGSMLGGIRDLAEEMLEIPVRLGGPQGLAGLSDTLTRPECSGAIGLALLEAQAIEREKKRGATSLSPPTLSDRILEWLTG